MAIRFGAAEFGGFLLGSALAAAVVGAAPAAAQEPVFTLSIRNHHFEPTEVTVPAGVKLKLVVKNLDKTPEEFESNDFRREQVVEGGSEIEVYVGPLSPGRHEFFGDFNPDTARGWLVAK
jgi:hypothetical protein